MKKILSLLLVLVMATSLLAACGGGAPSESETSTPATETPADDKGAEETPAADVDGDPIEIMKNVSARKAISMAFDKQFIVDEILGNGSIATDYFVPAGLASDPDGNDFRSMYPEGWNSFNPDEAAKYWAMAKEEVGFDTVTIELLNYDSEGARKVGEHVKAQLETYLEGVTVTINAQPFENKLAIAAAGDYQLSYSGWGPDYPDPLTFLDMWVTGGGFNEVGFSNEDYDGIIAAAKSGDLVNKPYERWEAMQEAERILLEDFAVLAPLYQRSRTLVQRPYVDGIEYHAFGGDYTYNRATTTENDGIIRLSDTSDIPSMNSSVATDSVSLKAFVNVMEGLVVLGANDVVIPGAAESWDISEDGLTYTFNLRDDAVWSNGEAVTGDDFVYAFRKFVVPETGSQYAFMAETAGIKNAAAVMSGELPAEELGVSAPDASTVVIELELAVPYFLKVLTFGTFLPQNQAFVEAQGELYGTSIETTLYNGPFVLSAWEIGYEYAYAKNDLYWDAANTTCEGVNFRVVKDTNTSVNLYETGEIDRVGLDADNLPAYLDDPNTFVLSEPVLFYLQMNTGFEGFGEGE